MGCLRAQVGRKILDVSIVGAGAFVSCQLAEKGTVIILCAEKGNFQNLAAFLAVEFSVQDIQDGGSAGLLVLALNLKVHHIVILCLQGEERQYVCAGSDVVVGADGHCTFKVYTALGQQGAGPCMDTSGV